MKELALDFVMGALSPMERRDVARSRLSDPELDREIGLLEARHAPLTGAAGAVAPPEGLFDRIEEALRLERRELEGKSLEEARDGKWLPWKPGIEAKRLWDRRTIMLRCRPGAILPAHEHREEEDILVISGDFVVGGRTFAPGDWHRSPKHSAHAEAYTRGGCLLLVRHAP